MYLSRRGGVPGHLSMFGFDSNNFVLVYVIVNKPTRGDRRPGKVPGDQSVLVASRWCSLALEHVWFRFQRCF